MILNLDETLEHLLADATAPADVRNANVSFRTPAASFLSASDPPYPRINLFLYEIKENRELRDPQPIVERVAAGVNTRRRPPLRVDCSYLVTAWQAKEEGDDNVRQGHELLANAFFWFSRFPVIPRSFLQGRLLTDQRVESLPPPTILAQMQGNQALGEFWTALGIPPRPAFTLLATVAMPYDGKPEGPPVTTATATYGQRDVGERAERWVTIGGTLLNTSGAVVRGATVRLEGSEADGRVRAMTVRSDDEGRFIFERVRPGGGYRLYAWDAASGTTSRGNLEIPEPSGNYDLRF